PVRLPPGRFRLATSPTLTGSTPTPKTIGMVAVAALAATAEASRRPPQSRPPDGEPVRPQAPAVDYFGLPSSDIRPGRSGLRHILPLSVPGGTHAGGSRIRTGQAMRC